MKFLVDAQLPARFVRWLEQDGHDARHTLDLPKRNRTPDSEIIACALREDRIVITKDSDFVQTFLLTGQPRLLLITAGNVKNTELESLLRRNLSAIEAAFATHRFVEVGRAALVIRD